MLQVNELNQYYGGSHILRGVSFEARIGEVTCLLGRNGVGKTTLLKCLMGLIPARSGSVLWQEKCHALEATSTGQSRCGVRAAGPRYFSASDSGREPVAGPFPLFSTGRPARAG